MSSYVTPWTDRELQRALYLDQVGTPIERIAEETGIPAYRAQMRIDEARRNPRLPDPFLPTAIDFYIASLGI